MMDVDLQALQDCPVKEEARKTRKFADEFLKQLRKTRRLLRACTGCVAYDECPVIGRVTTEVHAAIREINEEWGRGGEGE